MTKFKVGDLVIRNEEYITKYDIKDCSLYKETVYKVEYITKDGWLVLEDHIHLANPLYVLYRPRAITGYYVDTCGKIASPIFFSKEKVWDYRNNKIGRVSYSLEKIEIDLDSLLQYIKDNKLI